MVAPAKVYHLERAPLAIVHALEIVELASHAAMQILLVAVESVPQTKGERKAAHSRAAQRAAWEYAAKVVELLPADVRSLGEQWDPGETGTRDEWARCGAYLGALDGRRALPCRQRPAGGSAFMTAYSLAYMTAASASAQAPAGAGVSHG